MRFSNFSNTTSISFIGSKKHLKKWENSSAKAVIIQKNLVEYTTPGEGPCFIVVNNPDLALVNALELFSGDPLRIDERICQSATIHQSALFREYTQALTNQ
ncbi:hypothetical protein KUV50_17545 [Membranicola marinus]|uniref:UDP-3-O-[3-hydroxymyristoyl] glucosamine N-acyltransferase non-repeat region domain-containing protein n=1 Tax=Membranihabitans marinus TaxID=1227546 RepID=A0A953HXH9_9BACT|nr:LpxD N-terminal domain-containing protein [Membranihabitans marinus]MBY5959961.1 hypothetical protein [Membranihabitans marinus]